MNLKAINLNTVSNLTAFDKRPNFYWKFFHGNIKVRNNNKYFNRYDKKEITALFDTTEDVIFQTSKSGIVKRQCIENDGCRKYYYKDESFPYRHFSTAIILDDEYNNLEKIQTVCCERNIEADFNLIEKIIKSIDESASREYPEGSLIIYGESDGKLYDLVVYLKPTLEINMCDGTRHEIVYETLDEVKEKINTICAVNPNIIVIENGKLDIE